MCFLIFEYAQINQLDLLVTKEVEGNGSGDI